MSSLNKVMLIGSLGRDPETRFMQSGDKVVSLSLATSERWTDKHSGERREKTEWHRVVIWDQAIAEVAEKYLKKGSKAYIEGQLQTRKWTGQDGVEKFTTEIVLQRFRGSLTLLGDPNRAGGGQHDPASGQGGSGSGASNDPGGYGSGNPDPMDLDDDIPF